jgi:transposase
MTYNIDIINLFINEYINNVRVSIISRNLKISIPTLKRWLFLYKNNIECKMPVKKENIIKNIHKSSKKHIFKNTVIDYVTNNQGCCLDDIYKNINKKISKPSLCRILKESNISRKRCNIRIVCKDINKIEEERIHFSKNVNNDTFLDSCFIDECSFCVNDISNYGYSKKGEEILKITKHSKTKQRVTLLASMSKKNIICQFFESSIDSEKYLDFIKDNKQFFENKNIVQDNARIHHSKIVKNYCKENNLSMVYNPAYSPEFNPIELLFNKLKTEYRKMEHKNIKDDIKRCLFKISQEHSINFINHSLKIINTYK